MKILLAILAILAVSALAQTPLEFGIVRDLVGGTPRVSVFSIKTVNVDGAQTLQIAARAGIRFDCTRHSLLTDSAGANRVFMQGQVSYTAMIQKPVIIHFFSVIKDNMERYGSGGISQLSVDLITPDEMGWLSMTLPVSRIDSLLAGQITQLEFWSETPAQEIEIGTGGFPVLSESPLPEIHAPVSLPVAADTVEQIRSQPWKSLLLPGWGQFSSERGLPVLNILAEVGGIALSLTDEYRDIGVGVLVTNHLISFADLF